VGNHKLYRKKVLNIFEFDTEKEARDALNEMHGNTILTEVIYNNNPCLAI
jgi:hypothetical protein